MRKQKLTDLAIPLPILYLFGYRSNPRGAHNRANKNLPHRLAAPSPRLEVALLRRGERGEQAVVGLEVDQRRGIEAIEAPRQERRPLPSDERSKSRPVATRNTTRISSSRSRQSTRLRLGAPHRRHARAGQAGDQPCAALKGEIIPPPVEGDGQAVPETDEVIDVRKRPDRSMRRTRSSSPGRSERPRSCGRSSPSTRSCGT